MGKKIGQFAVHGVLDKDGEPHSFLPGTEVPAWAEKQLGDHCFEGGEDLFNEDGSVAPVIHHDAVLPEPRGGESSDGPPPKAGKGSGEDKWRAYAEEQGVDVSDVEGRDEIIAVLEEEGVAVE
jgi:hypothetical protein